VKCVVGFSHLPFIKSFSEETEKENQPTDTNELMADYWPEDGTIDFINVSAAYK
jgi:hypothetical protein